MTDGSSPRPPVSHPYWTDGINDPKDTSRLVKRVKLSDLMNYDPRASYKHKRLWEFHLGWSHKQYNWTSLASVRRIQAEILARSPTNETLSLQHIAAGNRDLVDWQYLFEDEPGKGHRGTRYSINWQLLELASNGGFQFSVHLQGDATSVHLIGDSSVTHGGDANSVSVSPVGDKDPTTMTRLEDGANSSSNALASATPPPHASGLSPAAAGQAPQGGFDELWNTYGFKQDRAKAKAAYAKLNPIPELHATLIAEAGRWATHYADHGVEPRWRVRLHNWLAGECWLQDPPLPHTDSKSAAISKVRGSAKPTKSKPTKASPAKPAKSTKVTTARITAAEVVKHGFGSSDLRFTTDDGTEHVITLEHNDSNMQAAGQKDLSRLVSAAGLQEIDDSAVLLGRTIVLIGGEERFGIPAERPDDEPPLPVKPEPMPTPPVAPQETSAAFAARMARQMNDPWPRWMDEDSAEALPPPQTAKRVLTPTEKARWDRDVDAA